MRVNSNRSKDGMGFGARKNNQEVSPSTDLRAGGVLSENMETNSYQSAAFKSSSLLGEIKEFSGTRKTKTKSTLNDNSDVKLTNIKQKSEQVMTPIQTKSNETRTLKMSTTLNNFAKQPRDNDRPTSIPEILPSKYPQKPKHNGNYNKHISLGQRTKSHFNKNSAVDQQMRTSYNSGTLNINLNNGGQANNMMLPFYSETTANLPSGMQSQQPSNAMLTGNAYPARARGAIGSRSTSPKAHLVSSAGGNVGVAPSTSSSKFRTKSMNRRTIAAKLN